MVSERLINAGFVKIDIVLILVVVEDGLGVLINYIKTSISGVIILVVVEDGLGAMKKFNFKSQTQWS